MRYGVSGVQDTALGDLTTGIELLGKEITAGRVLWLRSFWAYDSTAAEVLALIDATEGAGPLAANIRFSLPCASGRATMVEFPAPGLKFSTGCCVSCGVSDGFNATGGLDQGQVGGAGYEEG